MKDPSRPQDVRIKLYQAGTGMKEISEAAYFQQISICITTATRTR